MRRKITIAMSEKLQKLGAGQLPRPVPEDSAVATGYEVRGGVALSLGV